MPVVVVIINPKTFPLVFHDSANSRCRPAEHVVLVPDAGGTALLEVLRGGPHGVAAVVPDPLVGDEPGHGDDPARRLTRIIIMIMKMKMMMMITIMMIMMDG